MNDSIKKGPIACKLTDPELRKRKEEVIAVLKLKMLDKLELPDGYQYKFEATDEMLDRLTAFIKSERACCDFFDFNLSVSGQAAWLSVTGAEGVKGFIKNELEF